MLLLDDWQTNPFSVSSLFETNLRSHSPFLAYLHDQTQSVPEM